MKWITAIFFAGALLSGVSPLAAQEPVDAKEKLARLDADIAQRMLDLNYLMVECYIEYAESDATPVSVMTYPGLHYKQVCDTVAAVRELHERFVAADEHYVGVLKSDPRYEAIRKEYIAINGLSTS